MQTFARKMRTLFVLGSINSDLVMGVNHFPVPGETTLAKNFAKFQGGKGANVAVISARHGCPVRMIGAVGTDPSGSEAVQNLEKEGINSSGIQKVRDSSTGTALVLVDDVGDNRIIVAPGANNDLDHSLALLELESMGPGDALVAQFEVPVSLVEKALKAAKQRGSLTVLNPSPFQIPSSELLRSTDILVCNEIEFGQLKSAFKSEDLEKLISNAIVTKGSEGVHLLKGNKNVTEFQAPVVEAVDTTGAGDAFLGAFCAQLIEEKSLENSIKSAILVAASTVSKAGAQASYPSVADIEILKRAVL
ncbi:MAG: ribokinase [Actinomycetota bacterium]|jgi:ribokinase